MTCFYPTMLFIFFLSKAAKVVAPGGVSMYRQPCFLGGGRGVETIAGWASVTKSLLRSPVVMSLHCYQHRSWGEKKKKSNPLKSISIVENVIYFKQVQWAQSNKRSVWTGDGCGEPVTLSTAFTGVEFVQIGSVHGCARLPVWSLAAAVPTAGSAAAPALAHAQRQLNILVGLVRQ